MDQSPKAILVVAILLVAFFLMLGWVLPGDRRAQRKDIDEVIERLDKLNERLDKLERQAR